MEEDEGADQGLSGPGAGQGGYAIHGAAKSSFPHIIGRARIVANSGPSPRLWTIEPFFPPILPVVQLNPPIRIGDLDLGGPVVFVAIVGLEMIQKNAG